jgi:hypothetical protein
MGAARAACNGLSHPSLRGARQRAEATSIRWRMNQWDEIASLRSR